MDTNDFVVKSMSHCFLCLNRISSVNGRFKHVNSVHGQGLQSLLVYSLQNLSSFLKMDLGKVFNDNELISPQLLDKVRKSKLKGELCDQCAMLNNKFSQQYLKLAKIKMEMMSSLRVIQNKMLVAMETNKSEDLRKLANSVDASDPVGGWMGKLDILEGLRSEAIQKCTQKLSKESPHLKIQNLTVQQVIRERQIVKVHSICQAGSLDSNFKEASVPVIEWMDIKTEFSDLNDGDNVNNCSETYEIFSTDGIPGSVEVVNDSKKHNISYLTVEDRTTEQSVNSELAKMRRGNKARIAATSGKLEAPEVKLNPKTGKFKCSLCTSEFKTKSSVEVHQKSAHLGVKYSCKICAKEFTQRCVYNRHHRTVHMGVRIKCHGCNKTFKRKYQLIAHQRKRGCKPPLAKIEMT